MGVTLPIPKSCDAAGPEEYRPITEYRAVSHASILKAAALLGFPPSLVEYIGCLYAGGTTQLRVGGRLSDWIRPGRGVRQGGPLSPLFFCAVMDWVLSGLDPQVGLGLEGSDPQSPGVR